MGMYSEIGSIIGGLFANKIWEDYIQEGQKPMGGLYEGGGSLL